MRMDISSQVFEVFRKNNESTKHLEGLTYSEPSSWDEEITYDFPSAKERAGVTNGQQIIFFTDGGEGTSTSSGSTEQILDAVMQLKASNPELPVYHIHNHPSAKGLLRRKIGPIDPSVDLTPYKEYLAEQPLLSSVPSSADVAIANSYDTLMGAAIYHQDDGGSIKIWNEGDERNRIGTKLALEMERRTVWKNNGMVTEEVPINGYWAPEDEHNKDTVYIQPEEWESVKEKYLPLMRNTHLFQKLSTR